MNILKNSSIEKCAKDRKSSFKKANSKDDKHVERCSNSCILKEMQIKMARKHFFFSLSN